MICSFRSGDYSEENPVYTVSLYIYIWVCLKISCTPKPNGFADHYPYEKWLFHWEYTLFSDKPIYTFLKNLKGPDIWGNNLTLENRK